MDESESKNEKEKEKLTCDPEQIAMLKRCVRKKDIKEWNEWRDENPDEEILLEGADLRSLNLSNVNLEGASLYKAHLEGAVLIEANIGAYLESAHMQNAILLKAHLEGADLSNAHLQGAWFEMATVDSSTLLWKCEVNRHSQSEDSKKRGTDFREVGLDSVRIDPGTKQLLEYNIRRMNWEGWYKEHRLLRWPVCLFWLISDYGLRTWRVIATFFGLAIAFAVVYWLCPTFVIVNQVVGDIRGFWHALYFSVVTMTTLGFGDIAANPDSWGGQTLLMLQVILGYVLLGALVTRFAVLFTAGGPAGKFADEKGEKDETE